MAAILTAGLTTGACAMTTADARLDGLWGGPQTVAEFDAAGGRIERGCDSAVIAGPIRVAADGSFKAEGQFQQQRPGPTPADVAPGDVKAQFAGKLDGDSLSVTITADGLAPQTIRLERGRRVKLIRCL